ncbi:unnamed protein product [Cladocopium goreaui]|uniref:Uncharacterized protein n=1 Tax=Cladocopium goreaui TaxID=2562237 RepID=A0A9P1C7S6_9DINO|nr:unnamed protein product [Cladocopium goreaui]
MTSFLFDHDTGHGKTSMLMLYTAGSALFFVALRSSRTTTRAFRASNFSLMGFGRSAPEAGQFRSDHQVLWMRAWLEQQTGLILWEPLKVEASKLVVAQLVIGSNLGVAGWDQNLHWPKSIQPACIDVVKGGLSQAARLHQHQAEPPWKLQRWLERSSSAVALGSFHSQGPRCSPASKLQLLNSIQQGLWKVSLAQNPPSWSQAGNRARVPSVPLQGQQVEVWCSQKVPSAKPLG